MVDAREKQRSGLMMQLEGYLRQWEYLMEQTHWTHKQMVETLKTMTRTSGVNKKRN
jgi:hypothetical protein